MQWVVQILLNDRTFVLHGPFVKLPDAMAYATRYVERNPRVGTEVLALHIPHSTK